MLLRWDANALENPWRAPSWNRVLQTEPRRLNTSGRGTIGHLFDGEADDTSADLHGLRLVNFELYRLFSKNERAKLRQVILQVVILGALNIVLEDRMTAAD